MKYKIIITYDELYGDFTRRWYFNNELHREDGPAVEYGNVVFQSKSFNHFCPYFLYGNQLTWDYVIACIHPKEKNPTKNPTYNTDS
jgi:hypothetical protein